MKATIEGVRYDTDRATRICAYKSGRDESSPDWWTATLYRQQRADRYFLHGRGGFMTRFRMKQSIVPMTRAQHD